MGLKSLFKKDQVPKTQNNNVLTTYVSKDKSFVNQYKKYQPKTEKVSEINSWLQKGKMVVVSAYWCPDCRNNVPKMTKITEELQEWTFEIMDRDSPGVKEKYSIKKIPTFIIYNENGEELGRIIENPSSGSLEEDLLKIVQKMI